MNTDNLEIQKAKSVIRGQLALKSTREEILLKLKELQIEDAIADKLMGKVEKKEGRATLYKGIGCLAGGLVLLPVGFIPLFETTYNYGNYYQTESTYYIGASLIGFFLSVAGIFYLLRK